MARYDFIDMVGSFKDDLETYVGQLKNNNGNPEEINKCENEIKRLKEIISEAFKE